MQFVRRMLMVMSCQKLFCKYPSLCWYSVCFKSVWQYSVAYDYEWIEYKHRKKIFHAPHIFISSVIGCINKLLLADKIFLIFVDHLISGFGRAENHTDLLMK